MHYDKNKLMIKNSKNHLTEAKENYIQHMIAALKISFQLFSASFKAFNTGHKFSKVAINMWGTFHQ